MNILSKLATMQGARPLGETSSPGLDPGATGGDDSAAVMPGKKVNAQHRADARAGAMAGGRNLQQQLLAQTDAQASAAEAMAMVEALVELSEEMKASMLETVKDFGYDIDSLDSPEGKAAINEIKDYAGFWPNGAADFELLMALFLAAAERDRYGSGGGGGGGPVGHSSRQAAGQPSGVELGRTKPVDTANWKAGKGDVTPEQLVAIAQQSGHKLSLSRAREVAPHVNRAMAEAKIDSPKKKAAFLAQLMHESGSFKHNEEIASGAAYEGRRDLGNVRPGDGKKYKGRGFIQLTGRANYEAAGKALGLDLVNKPELAASDEHAARVAAWYWNSRGLNGLAEQGKFDAVTKRINGGYNGKADRDRLYGAALGVLKDSHGLPSTGELEDPSSTSRASSVSATANMSESEKYDYYKDLIEKNGGTVSGQPGQRNIIGVRQENHRVNSYDDQMAVIWKDAQGNPHVREFDANMESISRYQGRYGSDVNGDGRRDLATLTAGTHNFAKGNSSQFGRILRPTQTTAVLRDTDGDGKGDALDRSGAGRSILFHQGGRTDVGSAGCQTMDPRTFDAFWNSLGGQGSFQYTVVDVG